MYLLIVEVSGDQKEAGLCRLHRLWWRGHLQHLILVDSKGLAGVSMAWIWHGYGTDMAWIWHGYVMDMAWCPGFSWVNFLPSSCCGLVLVQEEC